MELGKVKEEMLLAQKIETIEHKSWQIPGFQFPQALSSAIIDMTQGKLKIRVIEPCQDLHGNLWYLVKKYS